MTGHFKERICDCKVRSEHNLWISHDGKESYTLVGCDAHVESSFSYKWWKKTAGIK